MIDFVEALEEGFLSARRATDARTEIDKVFTELDGQVQRASGGRLSIKRGHRTRAQAVLEKMAEVFALPPGPTEAFSAIVAHNPKVKEGHQREIATWSQDNAGYPCRVAWGHQEHICEDKEALSECLADLLRDPEVASTLLRLMNLQPATEEAKDPE